MQLYMLVVTGFVMISLHITISNGGYICLERFWCKYMKKNIDGSRFSYFML